VPTYYAAVCLCPFELIIGASFTRALRNVRANFGFCTPFCLRVRSLYTVQTDGRTDGRARHVMRPIRTAVQYSCVCVTITNAAVWKTFMGSSVTWSHHHHHRHHLIMNNISINHLSLVSSLWSVVTFGAMVSIKRCYDKLPFHTPWLCVISLPFIMLYY